MHRRANDCKQKPQVTTLEAINDQLTPITFSKPLNVLITRPTVKAQQLALLLDQQGIVNTSQALFDYHQNSSQQEIAETLMHADILIFVSAAAVEYAHASYPLSNHASHTFFAIGKATKKALQNIGINNILSPPSLQEHSEGLLQLPELVKVANKNVVIFRGNGGREHIANTLTSRGANVQYIESYQRVWRTLPIITAEQWRAQKINCIVVTSNDILVALLKYLTNATHSTDNYWKSQCLWVVVSKRIEQNAKTLGLTQVINTHGASTKVISKVLQTLSGL